MHDYSDSGTPDITDIGYDHFARRTSINGGGAGASVWAYDKLGRLTSSTELLATVGYGWDLAGNLTSIAYPGGNCDPGQGTVQKCVTRAYDDAGRFTSLTDFAGKQVTFTPDGDGNVEKITFPTGSNQVAVDEDTYGFDMADRMTSASYKRDVSGTLTQFGSIAWVPQDNGLVASMTQTDLGGSASQSYQYTLGNQLSSVNSTGYTQDAADNLTKFSDGSQGVYDQANQLCHTVPSGAPSACSTPPSNKTLYGYDSRGNRTSKTPPTSDGTLATNYTYNQANEMTAAAVPTRTGNDGDYTPLNQPTRIIDTRNGTGTPQAQIPSQGTLSVTVDGMGGIGASPTVSAVAVNLTVVNASSAGDLKVYPSGITEPGTSNLNFAANQVIANNVITKVGAGGSNEGKIVIKNDSGAPLDVILDAQGWWSRPTGASAGTFFPIDPTRIIDTRDGTGTPQAQIPANSAVTFLAPANIYVNENSLTANLTVTNTGAAGSVTALSGDVDTSSPPATSNVNFTSGQTIAGLIVVKLGADHRSFKIFNASNAPLDVTIDEFGYTSVYENSTGSDFTAVNPARILDTRSSPCTPNCGQLTGTHAVSLFAQGGLPWNGLTAVAVTLTAVSATGAGVISVFPHGDTGNTSNLNYTSGQTVANSVIVKVPSGGQIDLVISGAATDVLIDVVGSYSAAINTWTYTYNSDGLRITKTGPPCCAWLNATTSFTYDAYGNLLREFTAGWPAASISYIYGPDGLPVEQVDINGNVKYIHHDRLGSTRAITNPDGSVAGTYSYDAYGKQTASWFAPAAHLGYTGQYHDNSRFDTGFIYMRARFYDPPTGQFTSRDPLNALTRSAYGYVNNNPLNGTDPSGLAVVGFCGDVAAWAFAYGSAQGCIVTDGYVVALVGTVGGGSAPVVGVGATATLFYSNAERVDQVSGDGACLGGSGGEGPSIGGEVCWGLNNDYKDYNGIWCAYGGSGVGAAFPPAEAHLTATKTGVHVLFQYRDYPGQSDSWDSAWNPWDAGSDPNNGGDDYDSWWNPWG